MAKKKKKGDAPAAKKKVVLVANANKSEVIEKYRLTGSDTGSAPVQVALLTHRIRHLTEHLKTSRKDHSTRRGLLRMVGRRSSLLRYYSNEDPAAYRALIKDLGIRR